MVPNHAKTSHIISIFHMTIWNKILLWIGLMKAGRFFFQILELWMPLPLPLFSLNYPTGQVSKISQLDMHWVLIANHSYKFNFISYRQKYSFSSYTTKHKWHKVFKNGPTEICGRQPFKNWKGSAFQTF